MRSGSDAVRGGMTVALVALMLAWGIGTASGQPRAIGDPEIARALEAVKSDGLIAPERTFKTLKWRASEPPQRTSTPAWVIWIAGLFTWLAQSTRSLVWAAAAVLVFLVIRYVISAVRPHVTLGADEPLTAPTHVRDLDIRPESLPGDIGAAARALWDAGQARAALALLYRGLLSRLAHAHSVPILDSTTEGDCLVLTAVHLSPDRRDYASRLIGVWQRAVYGRETIESVTVHDLCDRFAAAMNQPPIRFGNQESGA
jgi:hypothetical protein